MKIRIYIDGYNLYYGVLKNTPYKWLDPIKLTEKCCQIAASKDIHSRLNGECTTKYFTSKVLQKATFSKTAETDQRAYHNALLSIYDEKQLEIVFGYHSINSVTQREFDPGSPNRPLSDGNKVEVWRIEEKQTDVNIAVHALKDAYEDPDEQLQIFVTNDTDLCPLLEVLAKMPHVKVGVIPPVNGEKKSPATNLIDLADWSIREIAEQHLCDSQLPVNIQNSVRPDVKIKGGIRKPLGWYGQSDLAKEIFDILHRCVGKRNKAFRWLEQAPYIANIPGLENLPRPAIEMLDDPKDALLTRRHAIEYAKYCEKKK